MTLFGDGGIIHDNMRANQHKIMRFSHLLANMVMLHTTINQTKVINKVQSMGFDIPDIVLRRTAPYWKEHLNRFGVFNVDMEKEMDDIEYDLHK